jgi:NADH-quinone oxidoreductase subunit F
MELFILKKFSDIKGYMAAGGYSRLAKTFDMEPSEVVDEVRDAGLRGRGGAGFPTATKWSFAAADHKKPRYLICNADEGEPGTFKDKPILEDNPHLLIEGMIIAAYAIQASYGYIYLRSEYPKAKTILENAIKEAYEHNYLGDNISGSGFSFNLEVYRGAGAYICGEETALIESLEGSRGQPRVKPPFPVNAGYLAKPTVINNVETFANVPLILEVGADAYSKIGASKSPGPKLYCVSGHVNHPGVYELPMGITLREIIYEYCGGIKNGRLLKAVIPGGLSTPILPPDKIDCPMDFASMPSYGSMLGSGAVIVFDDTVDLVKICHRAMKFFDHESCGKCTPCREGVNWMMQILGRMLNGKGVKGDIELLSDIAKNILGKTFCPLGDGAAMVMSGFIKNFRNEFEEKIK